MTIQSCQKDSLKLNLPLTLVVGIVTEKLHKIMFAQKHWSAISQYTSSKSETFKILSRQLACLTD